MRSLTRALLLLLILALLVLVLFFFLENQQAVSLVLFNWRAPAVPVAQLMLTALLAGMLVGPILSALANLSSGRRIR